MKIKEFIDKHKTLMEIARFVIVGGIATVIDFVCMSIFIYLFNMETYGYNIINVVFSKGDATVWSVVVGTGVGFVISLVFNYLASIFFVFSDNGFAKTKKGAVAFVLLAVAGLGIHTLFMYIGYDLLHINEWIVKIALTLIVMVFNYVTRKFLIFKSDNKETLEKE
ncbi:MAG: GtrA family protein [Clostridia bacterium]|nr:GtrA family protein [Clostridia bacterium]